MKGVDASYSYEGYNVYKTSEMKGTVDGIEGQ